jgi:hypothetical protein
MPLSAFDLNIIACECPEQTAAFMQDFVGWSKEYHQENEMEGDWCASYDKPQKGSQREGLKTIIIKLDHLKNRGTIVHELTHALFHLSKYTSQEVTIESQEWVAMWMEKMFNEICKPNYNKIKK